MTVNRRNVFGAILGVSATGPAMARETKSQLAQDGASIASKSGSGTSVKMSCPLTAEAISAQVYPTRAELATRNLPGAQLAVTTSGRTMPGIGGARHKYVASEPAHAGKFQTPDGRWWELAERTVTPEMFGAAGNGRAPSPTDDTSALVDCINFASITGADILLEDWYSVETLDFNSGSMNVRGLGSDTGFVARMAAPVVRSLLANRVVPGSIEDLRFRDFCIDGKNLATDAFQLERFTRGCEVAGVTVFDCAGDGFNIYDSWSYSLRVNRIRRCSGVGVHQHFVNGGQNAFNCTGNHVGGCGRGWVVKGAQAGAIIGNTSEYNIGENFVGSGSDLFVSGNYFEGFDPLISKSYGHRYCVILGSEEHPFIRGTFRNYVNGGSNEKVKFTGDGIRLKNVVGTKFSCTFSRSTRYTYAFTETDTISGCEFELSFDTQGAMYKRANFRNLTTGVNGGADILRGATIYGNRVFIFGDQGSRHSLQVEPNGAPGSIAEWTLAYGGSRQFTFGKTVSSSQIFEFQANDSNNYYKFNQPAVLAPSMTTMQRDKLSATKDGMLIFNTTTGRTQQYVESATAWFDIMLRDLANFADDTTAAAGGVEVGGFYRNGSVVMVRVA